MDYNLLFIRGLDLIKNEKKISFSKQFEQLGIGEKAGYNIRQGIKKVSKEEWKKFLSIFPDAISLENNIDTLEDPEVHYNYGKENVWRELAQERKKMIEMIEVKNKGLEEKIKVLEDRVKQLESLISK